MVGKSKGPSRPEKGVEMSDWPQHGQQYIGNVFQHQPCEHITAYPVVEGHCRICDEIKAARKEVLEMACKGRCIGCEEGYPIKVRADNTYYHVTEVLNEYYELWGDCKASTIRQIYKERFGE